MSQMGQFETYALQQNRTGSRGQICQRLPLVAVARLRTCCNEPAKETRSSGLPIKQAAVR